MAYCSKCGAYIPDGQSKCLACGYDSSEESEQRHNGGYAYDGAPGDKRRGAGEDEQRQAQERERRQEEYRRQAEEEFRHRQAEQTQWERQDRRSSGGHPYSEEGYEGEYDAPGRGGAAGNKFLAAASYLGVLCILPYLICPQDRFAMFHAKQGVALLLFEIAVGIIGGITGIGWLLSIFSVVCAVKGISGALRGRTEPLPLIGKLAERIR